jgi:hypothetical protein
MYSKETVEIPLAKKNLHIPMVSPIVKNPEQII